MNRLSLFFCLLLVVTPLHAENQTWYFLRHFEKQGGADPQLSEVGQHRAHKLVNLLSSHTISAIYTTDYRRTKQSVTELAAHRGLPIVVYEPSALADFATQLATQHNILVVGHSNTTPQLIALLGGPVFSLSEQDYGVLYILNKLDGVVTLREVSVPAQ
ncbi:MAG: histidine phosphatase family protein [Paraglaciecola sp.]|nr:histidine phosphatase family protein [Paraglaciecola sp.]NCT48716.1 histidine phosphatase family protein [Paraglaciecola sp.]